VPAYIVDTPSGIYPERLTGLAVPLQKTDGTGNILNSAYHSLLDLENSVKNLSPVKKNNKWHHTFFFDFSQAHQRLKEIRGKIV
jgi:hypothetical protein